MTSRNSIRDTRTTRPAGNRRLWGLRGFPAGAATLALIGLTACSNREERPAPRAPSQTTQQAPTSEENVTLSEVADKEKGTPFIGKRVTLSGEVGRVLTPQAFTLGGADAKGQLLVVSAKPLTELLSRPTAEPLGKGDVVRVTGMLRKLVLIDVEKEIEGKLEGQLFVEWEGMPAVVAERAAITPETKAVVKLQVPVGMDTLLGKSKEFYGKTVAVTAPVKKVLSDTALTLAAGPAGEQELLVVGAAGTVKAAKAGDRVTVQGAFRQFDLKAVEGDLGADLEDNLFDGRAGEPAIIATSMTKAS